MPKNKKIIILAGSSVGLSVLLVIVMAAPGFTTQTSQLNSGCLDISSAKIISMLNVQTPTRLPPDYSFHCGQADLHEVELLYASGIPSEFATVKENLQAKIQDGAIRIIETDLKSMLGDTNFQKEIGSVDEQIVKEFEHIKKVNPSLDPRLITINGNKAWAYEACDNCGKQTATFEDGSSLKNSFGVPARIEYYDDGTRFFLESNRPLSELIEVANSLH